MDEFEKSIILSAFKRCHGLRQALSSEKSDVALEALISLAYNSGMRYSFIKEHLEEIKQL